MDISRQILFGKLNVMLFRSIESATTFCKLRGNPYVELIHWIHQLMQAPDSDLHRILRHYQIDVQVVDQDISRNLLLLPTGATAISDFSHHIDLSIEQAWLYASLTTGDSKIRSAWLLAACLTTPELKRLLSQISPLFSQISMDNLTETLPSIITGSPEENEHAYDGSGLDAAIPGEASASVSASNEDKSALGRYCMDLTAQAQTGKIDPVVGREHEIRTMIDILLRRRQNNPLLTGEAGVGKTAVVEGLALAIAQKTVPPALLDVRLLSLDVGALLAGASMKGEFESRLKSVLTEAAQSARPVILFVDEVHTLVGAGGTAGTGDAANLLKPALARGTLRTIGATTWSEYKRHIEKDPALTRRFQVLQIAEPEEIAAINMVRGLVATFEEHHKVVVLDEAVQAAVQLSHRYIPSRQLPDKAISLLDTACARVALSLHMPPASVQYLRQQIQSAQTELALLEKQRQIGQDCPEQLRGVKEHLQALEIELTEKEACWQDELHAVEQVLVLRSQMQDEDTDPLKRLEALQQQEMDLATLQGDEPQVYATVNSQVIAAIVADWTGIPAGRMMRDDVDAVLNLPNQLGQRVIGQQNALNQISERIQIARSGLADQSKPVGVFLLSGPSGVGKTETALALAEAMYGGEQNVITINMSEFQEAHTISTLKGAPPGYVGYGEGGVLTEAVRRRPYSVLLLDEIEKAHHDVHEIFYQVFDKGMMEDGEGRQIDFKNTLILLTSNVGAELIDELCADPDLQPDWPALQSALLPALRTHFPAAFIGRLTVIPYLPLTTDALQKICRLHLDKIVCRMQKYGISLHYSDALVDYLLERCPMQETGVRHLINYVDQHVLPALSRYWLTALAEKKTISHIDIDASVTNDGDVAHLVFTPHFD